MGGCRVLVQCTLSVLSSFTERERERERERKRERERDSTCALLLCVVGVLCLFHAVPLVGL